jgi:MFS family permease
MVSATSKSVETMPRTCLTQSSHAWRWIFILEGLLTVVLSVVAFFTVSDFPEDAKWLSTTERLFIVRRHAEDQGKSHLEEKLLFSSVFQSLTQPMTLVAGFMYFGVCMSGYSELCQMLLIPAPADV